VHSKGKRRKARGRVERGKGGRQRGRERQEGGKREARGRQERGKREGRERQERGKREARERQKLRRRRFMVILRLSGELMYLWRRD
jgi:hypothetical protein